MKQNGGVTLIYQAAPGVTTDDLDNGKAAALIRARIDPNYRIRGLTIRVLDGGKVEINIPSQPTADVERIKRRLALQGKMEFLITANADDHPDAIELARKSSADLVKLDDETAIAKWVQLGDLDEIESGNLPLHELVLRSGAGDPIELPEELYGDPTFYATTKDILNHFKKQGISKVEALVVYDLQGNNFDDRYLTSVYSTRDGAGAVAIGFDANEAGAKILKATTSKNLPVNGGATRNLAIVIDDTLVSAPKIHGVITAKGMISGNFDADQVDDLTAVMRAGRFPFDIGKAPISETQVEAEQ